MRLFIASILLLAGMIFWSGCSTDVELNAPYKSTTVVFGLLDPVADTQWIKINKTFLGDGNNLDFAKIRDSSEYDFSEFNRLVIEEISNGNVVNEFPLQAKTISNKEVNGVFYSPFQTVYFFPTPINGLNEDSEYRLVCDFHNRPDISAITNLVKPGTVGFQIPQNGSSLILAQTALGGQVNYNDNVSIKWSPAENARLYDLTLKFLYTEKRFSDLTHTNIISCENKVIDWSIGQYSSENLSLQGGYLTLSFGAEPFFSFVGNQLAADPYVSREIGYYDGTKTRCFEVQIALANEELKTYFQVNSPVTGVIQERPSYSNITNGLGLFASRSTVGVTGLTLIGGNSQTGNLIALVNSGYTSDLGFCDPNPNNGSFSCNNPTCP